ncbi:MAG: pentapeptide repeat-containing protein [Deltaproteobacteria bacterium]|nr:pentapeptide repeat-containing protein [Deltaproteobacteria bacterium]
MPGSARCFGCQNSTKAITRRQFIGITENLRYAEFSNADLRGADLRGADLRDADLCDADLCDADLRGADLSGADLTGANLTGARLPRKTGGKPSAKKISNHGGDQAPGKNPPQETDGQNY